MRFQSAAMLHKGELKQKHSFGRWPASFFQLSREEGALALGSYTCEGGKMRATWSPVTGVESIRDRPNKQSNRFDVTAAGGKLLSLSATTLDGKQAWLEAIRTALSDEGN